ncbi:MAG: glycosyltransferase [Armatimonadota bacterium]
MQTWKGPIETLPEAWKSSPESIKKFMPDWEHIFMTDSDNDAFIAKHFPQYLEAFRGFKYGIQRADFIRYAWLATGESGLYLDCDYELTHDLTELFYIDREFYVCPSGNYSDYYTNAIMASKPGAAVWHECMELAVQGSPWYGIGKHLNVMLSTGPLMFTKAVATQSPDRYHILNSKLLTPCSVCDPKPCTTEGAYINTLEGSSWCGWDSWAFSTAKCNWRKFAILFMIIVLVLWIVLLIRAFREPRSTRE